ncbi:hypothetical protein YDYSY3_02070 [Paenibacillus chitinolyticus]|nr:hypothetical protein YDYSY3_02070 [Paenibacillus chitinolyticus]
METETKETVRWVTGRKGEETITAGSTRKTFPEESGRVPGTHLQIDRRGNSRGKIVPGTGIPEAAVREATVPKAVVRKATVPNGAVREETIREETVRMAAGRTGSPRAWPLPYSQRNGPKNVRLNFGGPHCAAAPAFRIR